MKQVNGWWKTTAITLAAAAATGLGAWLSFGRETVSRSEVSALIAKESPYLEDRKLLLMCIEKNTAAIESLSEAIGAMRTEQAKLMTKLDTILKGQE